MKEEILGKKYELEIIFLSPQKQKKLNFKYRSIDKSTNILSFPLSKYSGEITIDLEKAKSEAHLFSMNQATFLKFLVIHGMLHLKGFDHGAIMERQEEKFLKKFSPK